MNRSAPSDPGSERALSASRYRARHLVLPPTLISLSRVAFAACFPWVAREPWLALVLLALAGSSDVLDGWVARRFGMVTATGAVVDGITDKLFVLSVVLTLLFSRHLSTGALLLLGTRELGELPLVLWLLVNPAARRARVDAPKANVLGKAATVMQFATVAALLVRAEHTEVWIGSTALLGLVSATSYWHRELGNRQRVTATASEARPRARRRGLAS